MPNWTRNLVRWIDALNYRIGRVTMYLLFVMMGVMLWSSASKVVHLPANWTLEMAQFLFVAYYLLGAPYSLQLDTNVRMDLVYGRLHVKTKAFVDVLTMFALIFYLCVMLYGAVESTIYSFAVNEYSPTAWRPPLWPIKVTICLAFVLMILQSISIFIKDIAAWRGKDI